MNGIVGLALLALGLLGAIISIVVLSLSLAKYKKIASLTVIIAIIVAVFGFAIAEHYQFYCCETIGFTDTCKICGCEYSPEDKWFCCDQINYRKYCTKCGNERKSEDEQYIYCCEKKYNIDNDNYCSVCGKRMNYHPQTSGMEVVS